MPSSTLAPRGQLTLGQIGSLLLRGWAFVVVVTLLVGAGAYAVSSSLVPTYTATATEYFGITTGRSASELSLGSNYLQAQMASYGELATSPAVLNPVIDGQALGTTARLLARDVTVTTPRNTVVMTIDVSDHDPARAASTANAIAKQLAVSVVNVAPKLADGSALVAVQSIESAIVPSVQSSPDKRRDTGLGLLAGLLIACGLLLAKDRLDKKVRTPTIVGELTAQPLLGALRTSRQVAGAGLVVPEQTPAAHTSADEVRRLRAAVEQSLPLAHGSGRVLAITSAVRREGRSTVAANLASALAEVGHRTVLVDADLRNPAVAGLTGSDPEQGLLRALDQPDQPPTLQARGPLAVLPSSPVTSPTAVLASEQFSTLLETLRGAYDYVVLDTPALLLSSNPTDLADKVDGYLVVAGAQRVSRGQFGSALRVADVAGLAVLGVLLNDVNRRDLPATGSDRSTGSSKGKKGAGPVPWEPHQSPAPAAVTRSAS